MAHVLTLDEFSGMLRDLYKGPLENIPWTTFLDQLKHCLASRYATFILRPPSQHVEGLTINTDGASAEVTHSYNQHFYNLDPFVGLPNRQVITLAEFVTDCDWQNSEFYKNFMEPVDVFHILGADINTSDGAQCRIRISRGKQDPAFTQSDKDLLTLFLPHLEQAVQLHMHLNRVESERNLYAGAVDQLAVGTIILDQDGKLLQKNRLAERLLEEKDGIKVVNDTLQVGTPRDSQLFRQLVKQALLSQKSNHPSVVEAMRVQRPSGRADLGIIVRSIPPATWNEGKQCPSVAIFISDPEQESSAPQEIVKALFDLTPAEAQLAMLLANGLTLDEASDALGISRNTARAHLRSTFSKTGVTRQTMLVRLILRSVATLG
ncbi:helix-turn-helix transcriptional regulator [Pseudomonas sp. BN411]|uniref:helix-turn-helix transcriptional regulator n=1 Tax=Pseudomonas sp. BN411 TaxID=2567887 RepID=UPI002454F139|nr:helix-turn-helix transcriptional regulator [Pseudomonas sp. BN411]MDH4564317.1 helix-turn-helix transcriptional regulator [Pseudomonas sp. BN411]